MSPQEAYNLISNGFESALPKAQNAAERRGKAQPRCLDIGAGAGVSTQLLWEMGFRDITAVDWSSKAWEAYVPGPLPAGVRFLEMDDGRFFGGEGRAEEYDVIVYNFAVNEAKAREAARRHLRPGPDSRLLAPVNIQDDYWLSQEYRLYGSSGEKLGGRVEVGAWSVLFQPDVTSSTCSGYWCAPFNGFGKTTE